MGGDCAVTSCLISLHFNVAIQASRCFALKQPLNRCRTLCFASLQIALDREIKKMTKVIPHRPDEWGGCGRALPRESKRQGKLSRGGQSASEKELVPWP